MVHIRSLAVITAFVIMVAGAAQADVVRPPPQDCPQGHEPMSSHGGPYCKPPPPTQCPPEHLPKVYRALAYCEPPPVKPCPPGTSYASKSPTDTFCMLDRACSEDGDCEGGKCVDTSYCIRWDYPGGRRRVPIVAGTCTDESSCPDGQECMKGKHCDRANKRVASSPSAAVPVEPGAPSAAPPPTAEPQPGEPSTKAPASPAAPPSSPPKSNGCAGCATNDTRGWPPVSAVVLALGLFALGQRRKRRLPGRR